MHGITTLVTRQPAGTPVGGQFAPSTNAPAAPGLELLDEDERDVVFVFDLDEDEVEVTRTGSASYAVYRGRSVWRRSTTSATPRTTTRGRRAPCRLVPHRL